MSRRTNVKPKTLHAVIWCAVSSEPQAAPDKVSLEEQERAGREFAEQEGYEIVRIFRWDGYSRWESDPISALEDFASRGMYAYHELRQMWMTRAYDVLICYTHSRPGRSFTMQSWMIENSIRAGARVYRIQGGWIDEANYPWQIAIGGVLTTSEVIRLVESKKAALPKMIERGIHPGARPPISHRKTRNDKGEQTGLELDDSKRPLWNALYDLLIAGVGYGQLGEELFKLGFTDKSGRSFSTGTFWRMLHSPTFWGHLAKDYYVREGNRKYRPLLGDWAWNREIEPPEGVTIVRDVIPAVYTGEQAEKVMAVLRARPDMVGNRRPMNTRKYAGMFLCGSCLRPLGFSYNHSPNRPVMRCYHNRDHSRYRVECKAPQMVSVPILDAFMREFLTALLNGQASDLFFDQDAGQWQQQLETVDRDMDRQQQALGTLIAQQAFQAVEVQPYYNAEIAKLAGAVNRLKEQHDELTERIERNKRARHEEQIATETLRVMGVDRFMAQPEPEIRQWLAYYLDDRRFVVMDQKVVRLVKKPPRRRM